MSIGNGRSEWFDFALDIVRAQQSVSLAALEPPVGHAVGLCETCRHAIPGSSSTHWCSAWRHDTVPQGFCHQHSPRETEEERCEAS